MLIVAFVSGGRLLCAHRNWSLRAEMTTAEGLHAQAGQIAAALAAGASGEHGDALLPERVAPILRRLDPNAQTRAVVFSRDETVLLDTDKPTIEEPDGGTSPTGYSRLLAWLAIDNARRVVAVRMPIEVKKSLIGFLVLSSRL